MRTIKKKLGSQQLGAPGGQKSPTLLRETGAKVTGRTSNSITASGEAKESAASLSPTKIGTGTGSTTMLHGAEGLNNRSNKEKPGTRRCSRGSQRRERLGENDMRLGKGTRGALRQSGIAVGNCASWEGPVKKKREGSLGPRQVSNF